MNRIRSKNRIDRLINEQRASPVRWGRRVYLAILLCLGLLGLNWAAGDALILRADGLVISDRSIAGAVYSARVAKVMVREGQRVAAGDIIVQLESADMLRDIAQVSTQSADLALREVQLRSRAAAMLTLLPLAERHARESAEVIGKLDSPSASGLVSSQRRDQAIGSGYDAAVSLAGLRSEAELLASELPMVSRSKERTTESLRQLTDFYDKGLVRAPRDGTVGAHVPSPGQVVKFGDELMQISGFDMSVLAYLPEIYLFGLKPGDEVTLTGGSTRSDGVIEALLPVTDALPPEFQSTFRPRERGRLVRIRLNDGHSFAVAQKVQIRGCAVGWCWNSSPVSSVVPNLWEHGRDLLGSVVFRAAYAAQAVGGSKK